jgi:uncharacterized membrane protein YhhN
VNIFGWVLLAALGVAAVADWVSVVRGSRSAEQLAKPAFTILLAALAWLLHAEQVPQGQWLLVGLALSLIGDVLLLSDSDLRSGLGLLSFLLAHVAYLVALVRMPHSSPQWWGVAAVAVALVLAMAVVLVPLLRRDVVAGGPPTAYALVLALFAGSAWYTGHLLVGIGASLFLLSDALIAWTRFVRDLPEGRVAVMVTYHLAQALIVLGVLRPDLMARR